MSQTATPTVAPDYQEMNIRAGTFVDRRNSDSQAEHLGNHGAERRQFSNAHNDLSADARELALAIDQYKLRHRRRFINYEEMLSIVLDLGYHK